MKHFIISLLMLCVSSVGFAQSWFSDDGGSEMKRNQWGIDLGVGKMSDVNGSVGFSGGVRYQYNVHRFVGIDLIGVNYIGQMVDGEGLGPNVLQAMIGLRGKTPSIYEDIAGYLGVRLGYGHDFWTEEGGLATEFNVGVHLTNTLIVGYVFNMQKINFGGGLSRKYKFNGLRVGFVF